MTSEDWNFPTTFRDPQRLPKRLREINLAHRAKGNPKPKLKSRVLPVLQLPKCMHYNAADTIQAQVTLTIRRCHLSILHRNRLPHSSLYILFVPEQ